MSKNIITTLNLEQYNKKYRNRRERLLKCTKKEVTDFDNRYKTKTKDYLLNGRKWALIGDSYYQIPKTLSFTWFRNLHAACQVGTCVLAAGVVATAIAVPLILLKNDGIKFELKTAKEGEEFEFKYYVAENVFLNKGSAYKFSLDISKVFNVENEPIFFAFEGDLLSEPNKLTSKFITSETFKTNLNDIKKIDGTSPDKYEYCFDSEAEEYIIGEDTLSEKENMLNCTFVAKESGKVNLLVACGT